MESVKTSTIFSKIKRIGGWLSHEAALLISLIDEVQKKNNFTGDIFEIGVHHGKSSALFSHILDTNEFLDVCDIFEDQTKNISKSGNGNKTIFLNNIQKFGKDKIRGIYSMMSSELDKEKLSKNYRLFHIDGGHDMNEVFLDLNLAKELILDCGVIILDDPFRQDWPGVTEGLVKFMDSNPEFISFVIGFNKLMICKVQYADLYLKTIDNVVERKNYKLHYPIIFEKKRFCNQTMRVLTVKQGMNMSGIKVKLKRLFKNG